MGFAVVIASALTGLAVVRMYFSLFCGRPHVLAHAGLQLGLRPREAWTFVALVVTLIALGIAPRPLVDSRFSASEEILRQRRAIRVATGMEGMEGVEKSLTLETHGGPWRGVGQELAANK